MNIHDFIPLRKKVSCCSKWVCGNRCQQKCTKMHLHSTHTSLQLVASLESAQICLVWLTIRAMEHYCQRFRCKKQSLPRASSLAHATLQGSRSLLPMQEHPCRGEALGTVINTAWTSNLPCSLIGTHPAPTLI